MGIIPRAFPWRLVCHWALVLIAAIPIVATSAVSAAEPRPGRSLDCGANALFVLAELDGRGVSLDRLEAALPPRHPDGYSMAELAAAAQALGIPMDGVRFGKGNVPLDGPAIAFLKDARAGHFVVLRPVGTTGTMVQVIDPPHAPRIIDYTELVRLPVWTGKVLVHSKPWPIRHAAPLLAGAGGLVVVAIVVDRRRRLRSSFACATGL